MGRHLFGETIYLLTQKFCLPLMKGGRGMFHRTCDAMRTEHPPSPLHKGEVKVSSSILLPKKKKSRNWDFSFYFFPTIRGLTRLPV